MDVNQTAATPMFNVYVALAAVWVPTAMVVIFAREPAVMIFAVVSTLFVLEARSVTPSSARRC